MKIKNKTDARLRRKLRGRQGVNGTENRPRLSVHRSLKHIYAQVVDDERGITIVAACSLEKQIEPEVNSLNKTEQARRVGEMIGQRAVEKKIKKVTFDRGGCLYHGRVKALAEAARKAGLEF